MTEQISFERLRNIKKSVTFKFRVTEKKKTDELDKLVLVFYFNF